MSWICPKCERELKQKNAWHNCVKVNLNSLFEGKSPELVLVFDKLLVEIMQWKDVLVSTTQNCIVFVHTKTFLIIRPMKKELDLKFYSKTEVESTLIQKSNLSAGKFENHIRLCSADQITLKVLTLLKKSYDLL
ncbi:hypothetical protein CNR22_00600 [Sphingobacteriaceae bacterium]|nr:hypothetical protein CNR22_00600 [Sphingobacteriaceae bacterium]